MQTLTINKRQFKESSFTSFLADSVFDKPVWEKWFDDNEFFFIEENLSINNNDITLKAIPLSIAKKLQSKQDLIELNNKSYLDEITKIRNEHLIEEIDEQIYLQSEYASNNFKDNDITYICWIYKNGYLEIIGECKYNIIEKVKLQGV